MQRRQDLQIHKGSLLGNHYKVEDFLGEGGFGFVTKCRNIQTDKQVAIKINKNQPEIFHQARAEIAMLSQLRRLDPDTCNIIRWNGFFFNKTNICLNFELLDLSLYDYMVSLQDEVLPMTDVRAVLSQLNTALCHLGSMGIVHADLKPDNVMVVDRRMKPLRVKVIDFGLAHVAYDRQPGACVQTTAYRAPEVCVHYPFDEAIDMWSLGVVAAEMAIGYTLFPSALEYDVLSYIIETLGQPPDHVLVQARGTDYYFHYQGDGPQRWRLKTPQEFYLDTGYKPSDNREVCLRSLDDLVEIVDFNRGEHQDHELLVDLIKKMMHLDPEQRIKPQEVLEHPFLTEHLPKRFVANDVIDMPDEEQHQQTSLNETPGPEIIHQQVQKHFFANVVIDTPDEEQHQQSSLDETPGPEIVHQQVQKHFVANVVINMPDEEQLQQSSLDETPGPDIIHQQVQKNTSKPPQEPEKKTNGWFRRKLNSLRKTLCSIFPRKKKKSSVSSVGLYEDASQLEGLPV